MEFKKGQAVRYNTGTNSGTGKIVAVHPGAKGVFYEVKVDASDKRYRLRAAKLIVLPLV